MKLGRRESATLPGPAAQGNRYVPCECRTGKIRRDGKLGYCPTCGGTKWRNHHHGEPEWDQYLGAPVASSKPSEVRVMADHEVDAALARLTSDKAAREGLVADDDEEGWMRARNRRDSSGSYQELERALERLQADHKRALGLVYDFGIPLSPVGKVWALERQAVAELARLMPAKIKVPRSLWEPIRDLRTRIIRSSVLYYRAHPRNVAKYVGVSQKYVREVLSSRSVT